MKMVRNLFVLLLAFSLQPEVFAANWAIDNRLTTGSNNGGSCTSGNAWRSLYDSAVGTNSGSVAAGDTIEVCAGSGPYEEAYNTTAGKRRQMTDVTFSASGKTIVSAASDLSAYTAGGTGYIRVVTSSGINDGQYQVSTAVGSGPSTLTLVSSNNLIDEAPGATVRIIDITPVSSGLYTFESGRNGASGNPIQWKLNKTEFSAGISLNNQYYAWTRSATNTNEWYVRRADGSNPSLVIPRTIVVDGSPMIVSSLDRDHQMGTVGSLQFVGHAGYGDNDSLGYSTVYVRTAGSAPTNVQVGQIPYVFFSNFGDHTFSDGVWSFGNGSAAGGATTGATIVVRGLRLVFQRMVLRYADGHGFEVNASGPGTLQSSLCYYAGHRCLYLFGNGTTLNAYNVTDYRSHVLGLLGAAGDGKTGTMNVQNSIALDEESGVFDKKSATMTLTEGYNHFYPRMIGAGAGLGYVSSANWTATAITDNPSNALTTINTQSSLVDPKVVGGLLAIPYDPLNFRLPAKSPLCGSGSIQVVGLLDFFGYGFAHPPAKGFADCRTSNTLIGR